MQAAVKDLSMTTHNSPSFMICQRVLHQCHEIIFGDLPSPSASPYASLNLPSQSRFARRKVKPNTEPAMVGIGLVLAGVPGMPLLTENMGQVPIEQGRVEEGNHFRSVESQDDDIVRGLHPGQNVEDMGGDNDQGEEDSPNTNESYHIFLATRTSTRPRGLARRQTVGAAQTVPALPLHLRTIRRSRASEDPLGQLDSELAATPYLSSPSIPSARTPPRSATVNVADALLEKYDKESQAQLLRSHYCRSEVSVVHLKNTLSLTVMIQVQFLLSLENICNRLLVVPRPARVSALRAELTALNHKLPAEVKA
jgi:hypothetical protein